MSFKACLYIATGECFLHCRGAWEKNVLLVCTCTNNNFRFLFHHSDSNEHIRAMCIESLSRMTLQRPDIFLTDKYLKYFGWMMHDKDHHVRVAALNGLLQPFQAVHDATEGKKLAPADEFLMIDKIELGALQNVTAKFLTRIASSVKDVKSEVQEVAMKLMVMLLKGGFLDGDEIDDTIWDQVNECALSARAVSIYSLIMILMNSLC